MKRSETNFAYLMDLLGIKPAALCDAVGADKTLVSRWRTGARKLMPGHHWAGKIADYFVQVDEASGRPVLHEVLAAYYPGEEPGGAGEKSRLLAHWLTTAGQREAEYQRRREGLLRRLMEQVERWAAPPKPPEEVPAPPHPLPANTVVYGVAGVQGSALQFIELVQQQPTPQELWYVCPEGLDMYTRDERFGTALMNRLMELFSAGHTLNVVLRTDYKMTDISSFSGRWLVAHLLGYVKSYYFDEFHKTYEDKMMAVLPGKMAMKVSDSATDGGIYTAIHFDSGTVGAVEQAVESYRSRSRQRFHYHLFEQPDGFLRGASPLADRVHYQFARLPHFCLAGREETERGFALSGAEAQLLWREFGPLGVPASFYEEQTTVRQLYCEDDIEAALLKSRHVCPELSAICGRRVMMTTQTLVDRLALIKNRLETQRSYEVCFLPQGLFRKLVMQIACWGDVAAIGWITGGKSAACKDYTNVNALAGFCEVVWDKIPSAMKSRRTAARKLGIWLKKAEKYGYTVRECVPSKPLGQ